MPVIADNCPGCFSEPTERAHIKQLLAAEEERTPSLFSSLLKTVRPLMESDVDVETADVKQAKDRAVALAALKQRKQRQKDASAAAGQTGAAAGAAGAGAGSAASKAASTAVAAPPKGVCKGFRPSSGTFELPSAAGLAVAQPDAAAAPAAPAAVPAAAATGQPRAS